jgi:hypothetical protein
MAIPAIGPARQMHPGTSPTNHDRERLTAVAKEPAMRYIWVPESAIKVAIVLYVAITLATRLAAAMNYAGLASIIK